ncbi:MAG: response regulator, partial [Desulfuromonadales bacterium]|nr:response regulator [Desulfuromonadales bacterium]
VNIEGREILLLDLEYVLGEFDPDSVFGDPSEVDEQDLDVVTLRRDKRILMAEDSSIIRSNLEKVFNDAGFEGLEVFADGESCYKRILELKKLADEAGENLQQPFNLLISDIEMPKMDGLTLCRRVKETLGYKDIPVLLFSSLINPPMEVKCDSVGADGYASKPEVGKLINMMDHFLGIEK